MIDTKVRIVNEHGKDVKPNGQEEGEVIVKGDGVVQTNPSQRMVDGWLYTGDIGTIDEDGKITIVKPSKHVTLQNEESISSKDIEALSIAHPAIQDVTTIITPHEAMKESLYIFVVLKEGFLLSETELLTYLRDNLPTFPWQRHKIIFTEEIPITSSGKILKVKLLEMLNKSF